MFFVYSFYSLFYFFFLFIDSNRATGGVLVGEKHCYGSVSFLLRRD